MKRKFRKCWTLRVVFSPFRVSSLRRVAGDADEYMSPNNLAPIYLNMQIHEFYSTNQNQTLQLK